LGNPLGIKVSLAPPEPADLCEFANGGAQVTIRTKDGDIYEKILISNCMWIVAMVLFGVLRFVLAMVGVVARVVIKVKIDIKNGFGIWLF
jgi:hypothetical protein